MTAIDCTSAARDSQLPLFCAAAATASTDPPPAAAEGSGEGTSARASSAGDSGDEEDLFSVTSLASLDSPATAAYTGAGAGGPCAAEAAAAVLRPPRRSVDTDGVLSFAARTWLSSCLLSFFPHAPCPAVCAVDDTNPPLRITNPTNLPRPRPRPLPLPLPQTLQLPWMTMYVLTQARYSARTLGWAACRARALP